MLSKKLVAINHSNGKIIFRKIQLIFGLEKAFFKKDSSIEPYSRPSMMSESMIDGGDNCKIRTSVIRSNWPIYASMSRLLARNLLTFFKNHE